jgi:hypothetical protein
MAISANHIAFRDLCLQGGKGPHDELPDGEVLCRAISVMEVHAVIREPYAAISARHILGPSYELAPPKVQAVLARGCPAWMSQVVQTLMGCGHS